MVPLLWFLQLQPLFTPQLAINNGPVLVAGASPTAICPGFVSTLTISGGVSHTWSAGAQVANSITVSPASTSVYTITGETSFGCLTTQTISLLVNPTPTLTLSSSNVSVCAGSSATLSAVGAASYTW